ncbi:MAG: hypothetical protein FWD69_18605, partial [Polyangiaceae bacterium]|nr:hypothetical protein [Polyangiaceae bacterium]
RVPDRSGEHVIGSDGVPGPYLGKATCTNPLFAASLPSKEGDEQCNLPPGTRTADLIFFAVIGGVPNKLLHFTPDNPDASAITPSDWTQILGANPANFNYDGISPYMIQSTTPRGQGIPGPSASTTFGENGPDPVVGRDYDTAGTDLQYACTFDLPATTPNPCADTSSLSCDCSSTLSPPVIPPLCSAQGVQTKAKAYPTIRQFQVVKALGNQGIIASLCPIQLTDNTRSDYGYNPAVAAIVTRLKNALTQQCLPRQLTRDETNNVPCLVLAQLAQNETCDKYQLEPPASEILSTFIDQQNADGFDISPSSVCVIPQSAVPPGDTCKTDTNIDWCYVENSSTGTPAGRCAQALLFSAGSGNVAGARFFLQCIQQFTDEAGTTSQ